MRYRREMELLRMKALEDETEQVKMSEEIRGDSDQVKLKETEQQSVSSERQTLSLKGDLLIGSQAKLYISKALGKQNVR